MAEIVSSMPQNEPTEKVVRTQSTFPLSRHRKLTARFGEYTPFFAMESVERDKTSLRVAHDVRSFTLKSPLLSDLKIKKDYFQVPMQAILPRNWDKIYTNPVLGDDVPDDAICASDQFWPAVLHCTSSFISHVNSLHPGNDEDVRFDDAAAYTTAIINFLLFCELFYSNGSLIKYFDAMPEFLFRAYDSAGENLFPEGTSFDKFEEGIFTLLLDLWTSFVVSINGSTYNVVVAENSTNLRPGELSWRDFLCLARDQGYIDSIVSGYYSSSNSYWTSLDDIFTSGITLESYDQPSVRIPFNWSRLAAYQLVCYHYYSNDHVDYIYSSQLYREYLETLCLTSAASVLPSFSYNGISCLYDILSSRDVLLVLGSISALLEDGPSEFGPSVSFLRALFGFNYSLRFVDYFTGSKTRPLAVGDVSVSTSSNSVSVVDITRNIQRQRFLNAVNRSGRKFSEYIKGLFGVTPPKDNHDPYWLSHVEDTIVTSEVENTAEAQLSDPVSVTSNFRSNSAKYAFEFDCDQPSILLGILYFDIPRDYYQGVDRLTMHLDRFDMFNPFMQYIGDQEVYNAEVSSNRQDAPMIAFGYQMRHAEYKQAVNRAVGGFIEFLPGWTFLADDSKPMYYVEHIGPSYIRSLPVELDPFYIAFSGNSLAGYFHFIIDLYLDCSASRPMAFAPTIL